MRELDAAGQGPWKVLGEQRASNASVSGTALSFVALMLTGAVLELATRFAPSVPPGPFGDVARLR